MLLLHNTIPLICCLVEKTIPPLREFYPIYPADAWLHSAAAESYSTEPCSAGTGSYSAAAGSHSTGSCWCWITFRRSNEIACLNTHENDSSEESFEAIKLAVMPIFGILKHLFEVCKTFSAHNNPSSHSGISDTFVLYIYTIYFIN